jgi:hypothetical protein
MLKRSMEEELLLTEYTQTVPQEAASSGDRVQYAVQSELEGGRPKISTHALLHSVKTSDSET